MLFIFDPLDGGLFHFRAFLHAVPSSWNDTNRHLCVRSSFIRSHLPWVQFCSLGASDKRDSGPASGHCFLGSLLCLATSHNPTKTPALCHLPQDAFLDPLPQIEFHLGLSYLPGLGLGGGHQGQRPPQGFVCRSLPSFPSIKTG